MKRSVNDRICIWLNKCYDADVPLSVACERLHNHASKPYNTMSHFRIGTKAAITWLKSKYTK
jgi:hypothetical protein